jgi:hypothetical protein
VIVLFFKAQTKGAQGEAVAVCDAGADEAD